VKVRVERIRRGRRVAERLNICKPSRHHAGGRFANRKKANLCATPGSRIAKSRPVYVCPGSAIIKIGTEVAITGRRSSQEHVLTALAIAGLLVSEVNRTRGFL